LGVLEYVRIIQNAAQNRATDRSVICGAYYRSPEVEILTEPFPVNRENKGIDEEKEGAWTEHDDSTSSEMNVRVAFKNVTVSPMASSECG
jgi:hypothetical protein